MQCYSKNTQISYTLSLMYDLQFYLVYVRAIRHDSKRSQLLTILQEEEDFAYAKRTGYFL